MTEVRLRTTERAFLLTLKIEIKSNVANMVHDYSYTFTIRRLETFRR